MTTLTSRIIHSRVVRRLVLVILTWFSLRRLARLHKRVAQRTIEDTDRTIINDTIVVQTSFGRLRGFLACTPDHTPTTLANFRGIPFAQPPLGHLRWHHAQPWTENWGDKPRDATRFGYRAVQNPNIGVEFALRSKLYMVTHFLYRILFLWGLNTNVHDPQPLNPQQCEDCLTLNISVPVDALNNKQKLPVAVFIHGGAFVFGHASELLYATHYGSPIAAKGLVSVFIQYRLGVFGWVKVEGGDYNNGLSDMICALNWIHREIHNFGGDPNQVSIYGHSAGAMSVGALLSCPKAKGLFCRAILQSGACCNTISTRDAERITRKFGQALGISDVSTATVNTFDAAALHAAQTWMDIYGGLGPLPFLPVVDGDLVPAFPHDIADLAHDVDIMVGTTGEEALLFKGFHPFTPFNEWAAVRAIAQFVGPFMVGLESDSDLAQILAQRLVRSYMNSIKAMNSSVSTWDAAERTYFKVASAIIFEAPALLLAEKHAKIRDCNRKTFRYVFDVKGSLGSVHGVELPFLHGTWDISHLYHDARTLLQVLIGRSSPQHEELAAVMLDLWANFFKTGQPSPGVWLPFDHTNHATMVIAGANTLNLKVANESAIHRDDDEVLHVIVERKSSLSGGGRAFGLIGNHR